ncbi:MAG TPA: alpha/beta fold hydrolase [Gammaproteobacteria bacterium]
MFYRTLILLIASVATAANGAELQRIDMSLDLAGFKSAAELTLPPEGEAIQGAVLLLHGATPADMDFTVRSFDGTVKSHILKDIAEHLSSNGFAVLRYNKRHVSGPMQVDMAAYRALDLADLLDDAGIALDALAARPEVSEKPLYVYGWSEGSLLAGALAARRDDIAGLILQGAVADPATKIFRGQVANVTADFVEQLTGSEKLDVAGAQRAFMSDAGMLVKMYAGMALDPAAGFANPRINAQLDRNNDGLVSLRDEIAPMMEIRGASYLPARKDFPVRPLLKQIDALRDIPALILHGENDANVPVDNGQRIAKALGDNATYIEYPQLGHSLGRAETIAQDDFLPIEEKPLDDMANWLKR